MDAFSDGLGFLPRVGEPETTGVTGQSGPLAAFVGVGVQSMPDTSGPGPTALQQPGAWAYDFNPASGSSRATFNGEVVPSGGGGPGAGVSTFNTRSGDVTLTFLDVTTAGAAPNNSPLLGGVPRIVNTPAPGDSSIAIANTAFVQQAIAAGSGVTTFNTRTGTVVLTSADITSAGGAPLASPALTGAPTAPTAPLGDTSNRIATDAFVSNAIAGGTVVSWNGRLGAVTLTLSDVQSVGGAPVNSPNFTGTPTVPTAAPGAATTQAASTAFVTNAITAGTAGVSSFNTRTGAITLTPTDIASAGGAPLLSPAFTGTPTAPTPTAGDSTLKLATTAFVATAIGSLPSGVSTWNGRTGTVTLALSDVTGVGGAPLAAPVFTGSPAAPTPPALDNSTRLATTAFTGAAISTAIAAIPPPVVPSPSATAPLINGTAAPGSSAAYSRGDHVHPTDTSRAAASALASYLPLVGGALTAGSGLSVGSQGIITTGNISSSSGGPITGWSFTANATVNPIFNFGGGRLWMNTASSQVNFDNQAAGGGSITINADGSIQSNTPTTYKPGGGAWVATSDDRVKTVLSDYSKGLDDVLALRPVTYVFKGNDTPTADPSRADPDPDRVEAYSGPAPFPASPHYREAVEGTEFVGFIAQELEAIFPAMVAAKPGYIDGEAVTDLRSVNVSDLVYALVNAVKTLAARVEVLEGA